jgi:WD40 repeat protein
MTYPQKTTPVAQQAVSVGITLWCLVWSSPLSAGEPRLRQTFLGHTGDVRCVAIGPDGETLASGSADNTIRFWNVASGKERATLKAAEYWVDSVAFSPDGKTLASGGGGNIIKLWDVRTRKATTLLGEVSQYASPLVMFSPDGKILASGGQCIRDITLFDLTTGKQRATLQRDDLEGIRALAFTPDGKTLASLGVLDGIERWRVATGKLAPEPPPPTAAAKLIAQLSAADFRSRRQASAELRKLGIPVLPALRRAATAKNEPEVQRRLEWLRSQIEDATLIDAGGFYFAAFSPDAKTLAAARARDNHVKLWEVITGNERVSLKVRAVAVGCVAFSPDSRMLAIGRADGTIKLWDVAKGQELATLRGHTDTVRCVVYLADGRLLASGSADKTIKLWEVAKPR